LTGGDRVRRGRKIDGKSFSSTPHQASPSFLSTPLTLTLPFPLSLPFSPRPPSSSCTIIHREIENLVSSIPRFTYQSFLFSPVTSYFRIQSCQRSPTPPSRVSCRLIFFSFCSFCTYEHLLNAFVASPCSYALCMLQISSSCMDITISIRVCSLPLFAAAIEAFFRNFTRDGTLRSQRPTR